MSNAKALVLPIVAVAVISIFSKAQTLGSKDPSVSAAPSPVANWTPEFRDLPAHNTTRKCAELINAGLDSLGKEAEPPRKVHFEFDLTLPASK